MDITMKRQDYIKFCEVFPKETTELDLVTIYTEEWWNSLITRVVNGKRIRFDDEHLQKYHGCPWVIGLDIFIVDYVFYISYLSHAALQAVLPILSSSCFQRKSCCGSRPLKNYQVHAYLSLHTINFLNTS